MTLIFFLGGGGGEEVRWKTVRTYGKILATPLCITSKNTLHVLQDKYVLPHAVQTKQKLPEEGQVLEEVS